MVIYDDYSKNEKEFLRRWQNSGDPLDDLPLDTIWEAVPHKRPHFYQLTALYPLHALGLSSTWLCIGLYNHLMRGS